MNDGRSPGDAGTAQPAPSGVDRVVQLIRMVGGLAPRVGFERSFKLTAGRLSQDRLLLGVDRPDGHVGLDESIGRVCDAIGMPADLRQAFQDSLARANHVYFGAERDGHCLTFKAYLEFGDAIAAQREARPDGHRPAELYTGYKWEATGHARRAVSRYLWHPSLTAEQIMHRVNRVVGNRVHSVVYNAFSIVSQLALEVVAPPAVHFLEVREDDNARRSLDINVYKASRCMEDLRPLLLEAARHFAIDPGEFTHLLRRISGERMGHLAGGFDREGRDFLTFYFGGASLDGHLLQSARPATEAS